MANGKRSNAGMEPNNALTVEQTLGETGAQAMARRLLEPQLRHALSASAYAGKVLGSEVEGPGIMDFVDHVQCAARKAESGDLTLASRLLASQAITLDAMFTEYAMRAALNMGEYLGASESHGRLAFRAQSSCRATLEALAKIHQPREQTVRHVHVNEGAQAVIADEFHHHTGGTNEGIAEQCHAAAAAELSSALPSSNSLGNAMPSASRERETKVPNARRH